MQDLAGAKGIELTDNKNYIFAASSVIPDGNGGFTPCPELLTEVEAIRYLRLDTVKIKDASATLRRYRDAGMLRAVQVSKKIFYKRTELERFIERLMEQNPR